MSKNNVGKLLWELIEEQLHLNERDEARLLVGKDLIEQTYELRDEISQFSTLSGLQSSSGVLTGGDHISKDEVSQFIKLFQRETCSSDTAPQTTSNAWQSTSLLSDLVNKIRKGLLNERIQLEAHLKALQDKVLGAFDSPCGTPSGQDKCHLVIPNDLEEAKGLQNEDRFIEGSDHVRENSFDSATKNTSSSDSSRSSPRTSSRTPSAVKARERNSSHSRASPLNRSIKNLHLKNSERLSPSLNMLSPCSRPLAIYKNGIPSPNSATPDKNLSTTLPPLNSNGTNGITAANVNAVAAANTAGRNSSKVRTNPLVSSGTSVLTDVNLQRFNAAQRFRQMVFRNRQQATSVRIENLQDR